MNSENQSVDILARFRSNEQHKHTSIDEKGRERALDVITDTISQQMGQKSRASPPTPVEYFSACFCVVQSCTKKSRSLKNMFDGCKHFLFLLIHIIPEVKPAIIILKADSLLGVFLELIKKVQQINDQVLINIIHKYSINCIGLVLTTKMVHYNKSVFGSEESIMSVEVLLQTLVNDRSKIRKLGQAMVKNIVVYTGSSKNISKFRRLLVSFVESRLSVTSRVDGEEKVRVLRLLHFLTQTITHVKKHVSNRFISTLLSLMKLNLEEEKLLNSISEIFHQLLEDDGFIVPEKSLNKLKKFILNNLKSNQSLLKFSSYVLNQVYAANKGEGNIFFENLLKEVDISSSKHVYLLFKVVKTEIYCLKLIFKCFPKDHRLINKCVETLVGETSVLTIDDASKRFFKGFSSDRKLIQSVLLLLGPLEISILSEETGMIDINKEFYFYLYNNTFTKSQHDCLGYILTALFPIVSKNEALLATSTDAENFTVKNYSMQILRILKLLELVKVRSFDASSIKQMLDTFNAVDVLNSQDIAKIFLKVVQHFNEDKENQVEMSKLNVFDTLLELLTRYHDNNDIMPFLREALSSFTEISEETLKKLVDEHLPKLEQSKESRILLVSLTPLLPSTMLSRIFISLDFSKQFTFKILENIVKASDFFAANQTKIMESLSLSDSQYKLEKLNCLSVIVDTLIESKSLDKISNIFLAEIVLMTKHSNNKIRATSFKILIKLSNYDIWHILNLLNDLLERESMTPFQISSILNVFSTVLASNKNTLKSWKLQSHESQKLIKICRLCLSMGNTKSREIIKSILDLCKVLVTKLPKEQSFVLYNQVVSVVSPYSNDTKNRFKLKVKVVYERLLKRYGSEKLANTVDSTENKLVRYLLKQHNYSKNKSKRLKVSKSQMKDDSQQEIKLDASGTATNLLEKKELSSMVQKLMDDNLDQEEDFEFDSGDDDSDDDVSVLEFTEEGKLLVGLKRKKGSDIGVMDMDVDDEEEENVEFSDVDSEDFAGGRLAHEVHDRQGRRKNTSDVVREKAKARFQSSSDKKLPSKKKEKKEKGNKTKYEPYAYIKLDKKVLLNKRKAHEARLKFKGIGKGRGLKKKGRKDRS